MQEQLKILLVEDNLGDQYFFEDTLKKLGILVDLMTATSCTKAFQLLDTSFEFDLIFLDLNMPGLDGKECLRKIKSNERLRNTPVVIFSGTHSQQDIDDAYSWGAHYHVIKPYAYINYLAALRVVFEINWKNKPPVPPKEQFVINYTYKNQ